MITKDGSLASRKKVWVYVPPRQSGPDEAEKSAIIAACEALIRDVLKPRFLPEIRETGFNFPIDIGGAWAGGRYRFFQRFRSGWEENRGEEFNASFARIDRMARNRFDVQWMRHTGQWWRLHKDVSLTEALRLMVADGHLHPPGLVTKVG